MVANYIAHHLLWCLGALGLVALSLMALARRSWAFMRFVLTLTFLYVIFT